MKQPMDMQVNDLDSSQVGQPIQELCRKNYRVGSRTSC